MTDLRSLESPDALADALALDDYLVDDGLATAAFLAVRMERPLLLEGQPGVGKTELARSLARIGGAPLIRLQCYEGIDVTQALYEWDAPRQLLHLRAAEATGELAGRGANAVEAELYDQRFLIRRPLLEALSASESPAPVLLVDEVDRADDEFEALLLEVLSDHAVTIPELGTLRATIAPVVVLTSNRTRDLHDALKRRCLHHWVELPTIERETEIVRRRVPDVPPDVARRVATVVARFRELGLYKPPGIAETIDWATALALLGTDLTLASARATLGTAIKYREDRERVEAAGLGELVATG